MEISKETLDKVFAAAERGAALPAVRERRYNLDQFRALDVAGDSKPSMILSGHPAVFDQRADLGYFMEVVKPGAFSRSIQEDDIRALFNHDPNYILGRRSAANLQLSEDATGLCMRCEVVDTQVGRDLMTNVRAGNITQGSIGFMVRGQKVYKENDTWIREIRDVQLFDVSPVTFPAYTSTDMSVRSAEAIVTNFRSGPENPPEQLDEDARKRESEWLKRMIDLAEYL